MKLRLITASALLALLSACGGGGGDAGNGGGGGGGTVPKPVPNPVPTAPTQNCSAAGLAEAAKSTWPVVCMLTSSGEVVIELYNTYSPITVNNFLAYVANNYYASTLVHRVAKDFVIQGGGYTTGMVPKAPVYADIQLEDNNGLSNLRGTIAMARRADPNTANTQWFINTVNNTSLDYTPAARGYAVFGRVISGLPTVDAINVVPVYDYGFSDVQPRTEVLVYWVRRIQ